MLIAQQGVTTAENVLKALILADRNDPLWNTAIIPENLPNDNANTMLLDEALKLALDSRPELRAKPRLRFPSVARGENAQEQTKPQLDANATLSTVGLAEL